LPDSFGTNSKNDDISNAVCGELCVARTYEWNAALERTLAKGRRHRYLGAAGRELMQQDVYNAPNPNLHWHV
jgi:hypothetical protein